MSDLKEICVSRDEEWLWGWIGTLHHPLRLRTNRMYREIWVDIPSRYIDRFALGELVKWLQVLVLTLCLPGPAFGAAI